MIKFTLEIYFETGRYILTGLSIAALLQEIARADESVDIVLIKAYKEPA